MVGVSGVIRFPCEVDVGGELRGGSVQVADGYEFKKPRYDLKPGVLKRDTRDMNL